MNEFSKTISISYYMTDTKLYLTQSYLVDILQDLAIEHSDSLGYTLEWLYAIDRGWAIINWHICIVDRYPKCGEKVKIKTWAISCRRLQAERSFIIEDEEGNILVKATSFWVFMDLKRRRPTSIPVEMEGKYRSDLESIIKDEKFIMKNIDGKEIVYSEDFSVKRSETDTNGHTNNARYIQWAIDMVPDRVYDKLNNFDIAVMYKKECYKDTKITAKTYISENDIETKLTTCFLDSTDNEKVFCQVDTIWK